MLLGNAAEAGVVTDRLPLNCYVDHKVLTYNSPGAARSAGYISANVDLIQITQIRADGWCYGNYPGSGGRRVSRWFKITDVCVDSGYTNRSANVRGAQKVYRTAGTNATIGSVSNNESVVVLADNGSRAQIVYRLDNGKGHKIGWVPSSSVQAAVQSHNPEGSFDGLSSNSPNQITVTGWAVDRDNMGASLQVHVYVGGPAGSGAESCAITANKSRPDVHNWFANQGVSAGEFYGFNETINVKRTGNQPVYVYAINVGGGNNVELGHKNVNIKNLMMGDINGDGKVDKTDADLARDLYFEGKCHPAADFDGDGRVTAADLSSIRNLINNNINDNGQVKERDGWIKTNGANVYFRYGASTGTNAIGKISNGTQIRVLEHNNPNGWSRITYNGSTGYVASQYVSFDKPVIAVRQKLVNTIFGQSGGYISCDFDGYVNTKGRHEGIDMVFRNGAPIHAASSGVVTKAGGDSINTLAIYDSARGKTVVYLHMSGFNGMYVGKQVDKGDVIGYQGSKGASSSHIHVEVRNGKKTAAAKSVNDYTLENPNPYAYWESVL